MLRKNNIVGINNKVLNFLLFKNDQTAIRHLRREQEVPKRDLESDIYLRKSLMKSNHTNDINIGWKWGLYRKKDHPWGKNNN